MSNISEQTRAGIETLKQDIQQWQNKQPEYKDFNAGAGKLLREIELVDRFRLGGFLERLEDIALGFPHGSREREKLLKAHQDFFEAIKSNLLRRASMSLRGVKKILCVLLNSLPKNEPGAEMISVGNIKKKRKTLVVKRALIAAHYHKNPLAFSGEISEATGIDASDVRRIGKPIREVMQAGKMDKPTADKNTGEAIDKKASCSICRMPLLDPFECSMCNDIIVGECKTCHYTNTHSDDAIP